MRRAGPAGREADAELAGELGVGDRHERAHLLVARLDEVDPAVALERADDAIDAVARVTIDAPDAPGLEPVDEEIRGFHVPENAARAAMLRELFASAPDAR